MNDKVAELLEKLATKLGVTVGHLWAVLVAQVRNQRIAWIVETLFVFALTAIFAVILKRYLARIADEDWDDHMGGVIGCIAVGIFLVIYWAVTIGGLDQFLATFNNPEYVALKNVLGMISGAGK